MFVKWKKQGQAYLQASQHALGVIYLCNRQVQVVFESVHHPLSFLHDALHVRLQ
jgi:hypothetical protein